MIKPKKGDRVQFTYHRGQRIGNVIAVASTGVHYVIETPFQPKTKRNPTESLLNRKKRQLKIPLHKITKIIPKTT